MVSYTIFSCPNCGKFIDLSVYGLSCGLGPSKGVCSKCRSIINIDKKEWDSMDFKNKLKFFFVSFIYLCFVGVTGSLMTYGGISLFLGKRNSPPQELFYGSLIPFLIWTASILVVQSLRIKESKIRVQNRVNSQEIGFPSLNFGLQILYCGLMIVPLAIGGIVYYLFKS